MRQDRAAHERNVGSSPNRRQLREQGYQREHEVVGAIVDAMRNLPQVSSLSYAGLKTVAAIRLLAVCGKTERDPLLELTQRFSSVTTAKSLIAFADCSSHFWSEQIMVMRPCCAIVSPDEATLAQLIDAACHADRAQFQHIASGLIRADRQETLFDRAVELVAVMN